MAWCRWSNKCDLYVFESFDGLHVALVRKFEGEDYYVFPYDEDGILEARRLFWKLSHAGFKADWQCLDECLEELRESLAKQEGSNDG